MSGKSPQRGNDNKNNNKNEPFEWGQEELNTPVNLYLTQVSQDIKLLAEVEKIWINYDLDRNGTLDKSEVTGYLTTRFPQI